MMCCVYTIGQIGSCDDKDIVLRLLLRIQVLEPFVVLQQQLIVFLEFLVDWTMGADFVFRLL